MEEERVQEETEREKRNRQLWLFKIKVLKAP